MSGLNLPGLNLCGFNLVKRENTKTRPRNIFSPAKIIPKTIYKFRFTISKEVIKVAREREREREQESCQLKLKIDCLAYYQINS
jgi:hypothetical protein